MDDDVLISPVEHAEILMTKWWSAEEMTRNGRHFDLGIVLHVAHMPQVYPVARVLSPKLKGNRLIVRLPDTKRCELIIYAS